ncbi:MULTISPECIES: hypothetical protein [Ochrobactrum]|uniref:Uncharacterized protein n=1 Tax=Ochrobactrum quorumnocens TaxID=271865 RepID=A0A5N1K190_9HYPH|nr:MULTISPECIES: hypothetical protein [Brucella/Ochrobactrum group]KAA9368331.1 hypothetical protein F3W84_10610 [[Ochrobactrum] quorumnocens]MBD7991763.1 hypothetical protein [Ochrobactrum gallinarum]MDH7792539.1 hypothetical protein [Ochrobactrum sp. AN78]
MSRLSGFVLLAASLMPVSAHGLDDLFTNAGDGCLPVIRTDLMHAIRNGIEGEVKRREQALKMPVPLAGLSCLDRLMDINLDTAIRLPNLRGLFNSAVSDAQNQLCRMAEKEIGKLTEPLNNVFPTQPLNSFSFGERGAGGGPDIDYSTPLGGISHFGLEPPDSGPREPPQTILDELYHKLYGGGK